MAASGLITVPIYSHDSLGNAAHILANSGARLMVLDTWEQWAALAPWSSRFPALRHVWVRKAPLPSDVFLSFLPLAHAFERTLGYYLPMMGGATVAYARSVDTLREDLGIVRPTVLLAVPRIYERVQERIRQESDQSLVKGALVRLTADIGWQRHEARQYRGPAPGLARRLLWPLLDRFIARRLLAALGGRLRVAASGGASLPPDTARFLVGLGLPLVEGYGLTEAAPVVTATRINDIVPGSVGQPLHGLDIKLGPQDELLVRTPSVMKGYWRDEAATGAAIDADGWLRTGDVAEIRDGQVFIKGRRGERLALSTGEKVMGSAIEAAIRRDPLFDQACVIGEGRPCLVAVISLNPGRWTFAGIRAWCRCTGSQHGKRGDPPPHQPLRSAQVCAGARRSPRPRAMDRSSRAC